MLPTKAQTQGRLTSSNLKGLADSLVKASSNLNIYFKCPTARPFIGKNVQIFTIYILFLETSLFAFNDSISYI